MLVVGSLGGYYMPHPRRLHFILRLLRQEDRVNARNNTPRSDGDPLQQLVDLVIMADGELEVPGVDGGPLALLAHVPSQLNQLGSEILHDGGQVDGNVSLHPVGHTVVVAFLQVFLESQNGEDNAGPLLLGPGLDLAAGRDFLQDRDGVALLHGASNGNGLIRHACLLLQLGLGWHGRFYDL